MRECAVESLRAALSLASQREAKSSQSSNFYKVIVVSDFPLVALSYLRQCCAVWLMLRIFFAQLLMPTWKTHHVPRIVAVPLMVFLFGRIVDLMHT